MLEVRRGKENIAGTGLWAVASEFLQIFGELLIVAHINCREGFGGDSMRYQAHDVCAVIGAQIKPEPFSFGVPPEEKRLKHRQKVTEDRKKRLWLKAADGDGSGHSNQPAAAPAPAPAQTAAEPKPKSSPGEADFSAQVIEALKGGIVALHEEIEAREEKKTALENALRAMTKS
jgi:hypothetical protein